MKTIFCYDNSRLWCLYSEEEREQDPFFHVPSFEITSSDGQYKVHFRKNQTKDIEKVPANEQESVTFIKPATLKIISFQFFSNIKFSGGIYKSITVFQIDLAKKK